MKSIISLVLIAVVAALTAAQDRETFEQQGSQSTVQEDCDPIVPYWPPLGTINNNWAYPPIKRKTISVSTKKKDTGKAVGSTPVAGETTFDPAAIEEAKKQGYDEGKASMAGEYQRGHKDGLNAAKGESETRPQLVLNGVHIFWPIFWGILGVVAGGIITFLWATKFEGYKRQRLKLAAPEPGSTAGDTPPSSTP